MQVTATLQQLLGAACEAGCPTASISSLLTHLTAQRRTWQHFTPSTMVDLKPALLRGWVEYDAVHVASGTVLLGTAPQGLFCRSIQHTCCQPRLCRAFQSLPSGRVPLCHPCQPPHTRSSTLLQRPWPALRRLRLHPGCQHHPLRWPPLSTCSTCSRKCRARKAVSWQTRSGWRVCLCWPRPRRPVRLQRPQLLRPTTRRSQAATCKQEMSTLNLCTGSTAHR